MYNQFLCRGWIGIGQPSTRKRPSRGSVPQHGNSGVVAVRRATHQAKRRDDDGRRTRCRYDPQDASRGTWRLAQHLLTLGDEVPVRPGTSRLTVAATAVYAADRLLPGKHLTQQRSPTRPARSWQPRKTGPSGTTANSSTPTKRGTAPRILVSASRANRTPCAERGLAPLFRDHHPVDAPPPHPPLRARCAARAATTSLT